MLNKSDMVSWKNLMKGLVIGGADFIYDFGYLFRGCENLIGPKFKVEMGMVIKDIASESENGVELKVAIYELINMLNLEELVNVYDMKKEIIDIK